LLPFEKRSGVGAIVQTEASLKIVKGDFFSDEVSWIIGGHELFLNGVQQNE